MSTIDKSILTSPVLVVDDHAITRDMVRTILRGVGFTDITVLDNGRIAWHHVKENRVRLVVCDWNMPGGSGIELLRDIRNNPQYKDLPFIMLTAEAYRESVEEALRVGVTDYVAKPFTAEMLISKITKALAK